MYNLKYDFKQFNNGVSKYMNIVIDLSAEQFQKQIKNGQVRDIKHDTNALALGIKYLEEYLYYNFQNSPQIFASIYNSIANKARIISVLPYNERGIYGKFDSKNQTIFINPNLDRSRTLTGEERTRLYMAHELGHAINDNWMNKVLEYCDQNISQRKLTEEQATLIYDGFSMLNEATTQDRAEEFAYKFSGKKRPRQQLVSYKDKKLFDGQQFQTNFDYYGELQAPTIMFARTLRGIGKENNDMKALSMLSKRALSSDFFKSILDEYSRDGNMQSFIKAVQYMGLLKRASYANFGYGDEKYLRDSNKNLQSLRALTSKMRNYKEPFVAGDGR